MFFHFLQALFLGLALAAPVGPVNMLCVHQVVHRGWQGGLSVALGALLGDSLFALLGLTGLVTLQHLSSDFMRIVGAVGILFMMGMGITLLFRHPHVPVTTRSHENFFKGLFITLSNPITLGGTLLGMAALQSPLQSFSEKLLLWSGVCVGSGLWWFFLVILSLNLKKHLETPKAQHRLSQASGVLILVCGLFFLYKALSGEMVLFLPNAS